MKMNKKHNLDSIPEKLYFFNVVWGKKYVDFFLNYSLPSQNTPNNLPFISKKLSSAYYLYTSPEDARYIQKSEIYKEVSSYLDIRFIDYGEQIKAAISRGKHEDGIDKKYEMFRTLTLNCLSLAQDDGAAICFLCPDVHVDKNYYKGIYELVVTGKRVVYTPHLTVCMEDYLEELKSVNWRKDPLSASDLLDISSRALHPIYYPELKEKKLGTVGQLLWELSPNYYMFRNLHYHPIYIYPRKKVNTSAYDHITFRSLDTSLYIPEVCPNRKEYGYIDSNKSYLFEISEGKENRWGKPGLKKSVCYHAFIVKVSAFAFHIKNYSLGSHYIKSSNAKKSTKFYFNKLKADFYCFRLFTLLSLPMFIAKPFLVFGMMKYLQKKRTKFMNLITYFNFLIHHKIVPLDKHSVNFEKILQKKEVKKIKRTLKMYGVDRITRMHFKSLMSSSNLELFFLCIPKKSKVQFFREVGVIQDNELLKNVLKTPDSEVKLCIGLAKALRHLVSDGKIKNESATSLIVDYLSENYSALSRKKRYLAIAQKAITKYRNNLKNGSMVS